jgi:hypothetical protein
MEHNCGYDFTILPVYFITEVALYPYYILESAYYRAEKRTYPKPKYG